jgi:hypothetical protein
MTGRLSGMRGKYRLRTAMRENLPESLAARILKGPYDCGDHEWYKAEENTWRCYHCMPGLTHDVPWDEQEVGARRYEAGAMLVRAGLRDPGVPHH